MCNRFKQMSTIELNSNHKKIGNTGICDLRQSGPTPDERLTTDQRLLLQLPGALEPQLHALQLLEVSAKLALQTIVRSITISSNNYR